MRESCSATAAFYARAMVWLAIAPWLLLAAVVHAGLVLYLAGVRFPAVWLRLHGGSSGPAMGTSALVHAGAGLVLAWWAVDAVLQQPTVISYLDGADSAADVESPIVSLPHMEAPAAGNVGEAGASASAEQVATPGAAIQGLAGLDAADDDATLRVARVGGLRLGGGGDDGYALGESGDGSVGRELAREFGSQTGPSKGKANFFGISASGTSFVFVVDKSGSMQGSRFRRAKHELRRSFEALSERQQFFIVFFDTGAYPLPTPGLIEANQKNHRDTVRWLNKVEPDGNTNPLPAMLQAMSLRPDAIFLLTDGDFPRVVADQIVAFQGEKVIPIHTVGFESRAGEFVLESISRRTGGTYRFVK